MYDTSKRETLSESMEDVRAQIRDVELCADPDDVDVDYPRPLAGGGSGHRYHFSEGGIVQYFASRVKMFTIYLRSIAHGWRCARFIARAQSQTEARRWPSLLPSYILPGPATSSGSTQ